MSNNQPQLNTDDFSEFDFDENDVLVKDENEKIVPEEQEIKKSKNQGIKTRDVFKKMPVAIRPVGLPIQPAAKSLKSPKLKIEAPLELKKLKIYSEDSAEKMRENLIKEAGMQKDKIEALGREGEGLVYGEKDEEEIEKFKKNPLAKSNFNIDLLVRELMSRLNIVSTLKIDLINRLKNIISSFLRDVRASRATEELLQRSAESGGLNLSKEHSEQIMDFIKDEHKRIHSIIFAAADNVEAPKENDLVEPSKSVKSPKEDVEVISKKTAREAQVGIFSDEIANSYKKDSSKARFGGSGEKVLTQWENGLAVPCNLRTPEISAPKSVKKLVAGTNVAEAAKVELSKTEKPKEPAKSDLVFKDFKREEVLESLNEAFAQDENKVQNLEKKKPSWFSRMFGSKSIKSKVKSQKSAESKVQSLKSKVNKSEPSLKKILVAKKEMPYQQPIVRRVVQDKSNFNNHRKMEDVKVVHPHLVGPIEELAEMTLVDFRRLGSTVQDSVDKIREKIEISAKEFFNQKIVAINAWRKSQPNQFYVELGRQSLFKRLPVEDLISQYNLESKPTLTKEEFKLINQLNKKLRY